MVIILKRNLEKLIVLIVLLKLCSLSTTQANQMVMDSKSVLLVQEKQKKLQSVMSELSSIAEETKAAEEGAIAKRNLAEKSQTEYEKLTAEELMQIAYSRDSALRADAALNKVLADEESINDIDKKVFELKLKNTQLKKKLLRTENELANAQIQYITTRNQTLYPYNADKEVKMKPNANSNIHNGLEFLNHMNFDPRRAFDISDQVSLVNGSNIVSGPKALRRGLVSEGLLLDSLKPDKEVEKGGNFNRLNITEVLNNTLLQLDPQITLSETHNNTKSTLDNFFPYNLNLFPSYMSNSSAVSRENSELINSPPSLKDSSAVSRESSELINSPPSLKDSSAVSRESSELISAQSLNNELDQRPWGDTARFKGENVIDMSIPGKNEASFADTFLNSYQQQYDNNTIEKQKNLSGGDVMPVNLNSSKVF